MPKPRPTQVPDSENWTFIQRGVSPDELTELAKNLVTFKGQPYEPKKAAILSFLPGTESQRAKRWSDYWIIIIQMLGLAYTTRSSELLHTTKFAEYLATSGQPIEGFFDYWALKFQFPWAQSKHREWKELGKVVQPAVFILRHLVAIFEKAIRRGDPVFRDTYLTYEEIVLVLMKSFPSDMYQVYENTNLILERRRASFNYAPLKVQGYESQEEQFRNRTRLYFEQTDVIQFDQQNNRILISDWPDLFAALAFLSFVESPTVLDLDEDSRTQMFEDNFNNLNPHPEALYLAINNSRDTDGYADTQFNLAEIVQTSVASAGYSYERDFIEAFLLSLKTKPFVILSGVSGTGKTALPRLIMRLSGNTQLKPIAVAPDWTDSSDMLGYFNLDNQFVTGEFSVLVEEAIQNPHIPYFAILDEMNLSRVEYYFAQVLSGMESRQYDEVLDRVQYNDFLFNPGMRSRLQASENLASDLKIPPNVYIVGTVNIDETTHPFSKKVLDRANVLEIRDINLMEGLLGGAAASEQSLPALNYFYSGNITNLTDLKRHWSLSPELDLPMDETLELWVKELEKFNEVLLDLKMNFGYRVRDEVCIYLYHAAGITSERPRAADWWAKYFDQQLVQKILTRFYGEQNQIEGPIKLLFNLCLNQGVSYSQDQILAAEIKEDANILYRKAASKLRLMLHEVVTENKPSTSFWMV